MSKTPQPRSRNDAPIWIFGGVFLAVFAFFLFWGELIFLGESGVKALLLERAVHMRGAPPAKAAAEIGRMVKSFLDDSKHASQVNVSVDEASSRRIVYTLILPWSEKSVKLHQRRGGTTIRFTAALLKTAGAGRVAVVVNVRRKKINAEGSDPAGQARFEPITGKFEWISPQGR